MRRLLTLLLLSSLWTAACTKPRANTATPVLTPSVIDVRGYFGHTRRTFVEFFVDGQPLVLSEAQFTITHGAETPAFGVSFVPLSREVTITYSPEVDDETNANLQIAYRGQEYTVQLHGLPIRAPQCKLGSDECILVRFNPDTDECEDVPRSDNSCESSDCTNPGRCVSGVCVHQEIEHAAPSCFQAAPTRQVTPAWIYTSPSKNAPTGPLVLDEDRNAYFFEYPSGDFVSLDHAGSVRWRKSLFNVTSDSSSLRDVKLSSRHVFVLERGTGHIAVFSHSDGALLWEKTLGRSTLMLPVGDELWTLADIRNPSGSELRIFDASTGALLDTPTQPQFVEDSTFVYDLLLSNEEGRVYLMGGNDVANPTMVALAAMDTMTRDIVWTTTVVLRSKALALAVAYSGSLLLLQDGLMVDLKTQERFDNTSLVPEPPFINAMLFTLNADGTGFQLQAEQGECSTFTLRHVNMRDELSDWNCFLGASNTLSAPLLRTPSGSAVVMSFDLQDGGDDMHRSWLRIIDAAGVEQFSGVLTGGVRGSFLHPLQMIHGQRLLIRQIDNETHGQKRLVAYDIPELLTK